MVLLGVSNALYHKTFMVFSLTYSVLYERENMTTHDSIIIFSRKLVFPSEITDEEQFCLN